MSSGSKSTAAPPPELADWQVRALEEVVATPLAQCAVFGGGASLAAVHLHHRRSEDLDLFLPHEPTPADMHPLARRLRAMGTTVEVRRLGPLMSLVLLRRGEPFGRIDLAFHPFESIERPKPWRGLLVESALDMAVNKTQAVLTRFQPRDFVDLWFLLREGPERDLERLLDYVRAKFDFGADRLSLAERLLLARDIAELPELLRPVALEDLVRLFEDRARDLVRAG